MVHLLLGSEHSPGPALYFISFTTSDTPCAEASNVSCLLDRIKTYKKCLGLCFLCWLIAWRGPRKQDPHGEGISSALVWEPSPLSTSRLGTLLCDMTMSFMGEADPPCVCLRQQNCIENCCYLHVTQAGLSQDLLQEE